MRTMLQLDVEGDLLDVLADDSTTPERLADRVETIVNDLRDRVGDREPFELPPLIARRLAEVLGLDEPLPARDWMHKLTAAVRRLRQEVEARERIEQQAGGRMSLSTSGAQDTAFLNGHRVRVVERFADGTALVEHADKSRLHTMQNKLAKLGGVAPAPDGWVEQATAAATT